MRLRSRSLVLLRTTFFTQRVIRNDDRARRLSRGKKTRALDLALSTIARQMCHEHGAAYASVGERRGIKIVIQGIAAVSDCFIFRHGGSAALVGADGHRVHALGHHRVCLLYTSPS